MLVRLACVEEMTLSLGHSPAHQGLLFPSPSGFHRPTPPPSLLGSQHLNPSYRWGNQGSKREWTWVPFFHFMQPLTPAAPSAPAPWLSHSLLNSYPSLSHMTQRWANTWAHIILEWERGHEARNMRDLRVLTPRHRETQTFNKNKTS